eukprot:1155643-Pelagomonas_calceolata.AAC.1
MELRDPVAYRVTNRIGHCKTKNYLAYNKENSSERFWGLCQPERTEGMASSPLATRRTWWYLMPLEQEREQQKNNMGPFKMLEVEQQQTDLNASHCNQICYHQGAPIQTAMKATHECRDLPGVVAEVHNKSHPASLQLLRLEKAIHCQSMFGGRRHQGPVVENLFAQWCLAGDEPAHGRPNGSIVSPLLR